jgi:L-ascorbate metabolism protein UlaG (beta-lactamase superfamily)
MSSVYLKSTIKVEPLVWRWYAWPHLISPITAACNIVDRHLKIMRSYVQNPHIHAQAVKDPKMLGGPFLDLEELKTDKIRELIEYTNINCKKLIELSKAIREADLYLQEAKGGSLEDCYQLLPNMLRGYVELVYDLNNHPALRFIEPLIYKTYYDEQAQEVAISNTYNDFRKFVLSTPRLDDKAEIYLKIPFSDKKLDFLFSLKTNPCEVKDIINIFNIPNNKQDLFKSFFTDVSINNRFDNNYLGDGIRVRYFGHACILIQTKDISILFDPVISYSVVSDVPRYTFDDLPDRIDFVIITHNHQDHLVFETLLQLRYKVAHIIFPTNQKGFLADPSIKLILQYTGFRSLIELDELDIVPFKDGNITALPFLGEHSDLNIHAKLAYCINIKGKKLMFAADSNNLEEFLYDHIHELIGDVDMLFVGMECDGAPLTWLYGPLLSRPLNRAFDRSRQLSGSNFYKAWSIVKKLKCKSAYVYAMGQEPWLHHIMALSYTSDSIQIIESDKFVSACKSHGIASERLFAKKEWII